MTSRGPRRVGQRGEGGLLLPLLALGMAAGLVGGVSLWLAAGLSGKGFHDEGTRVRLSAARQALLAHASAYPDLYGPAGAGPGHLVCPDTDTPLDVRVSPTSVDAGARRTGAAFRSDGPDPPCGRGSLAVGRLPRHVSLPGGRRAFHVEHGQRFVYAVSTRYVNNPLGRVVNLASGTISGSGSGEPLVGTVDDVVAIVLDPGGVALPEVELAGADDPLELLGRARDAVRREAGARAARALPHAFLRRDALLDAAARRVAAWFVDTATSVALGHCRNAGGPSIPGPIASELVEGVRGTALLDDRLVCHPRWPTVDRCNDEHAPLRWLGEVAVDERTARDTSIGGRVPGTASESTADCESADEAPLDGRAVLPDAIENTPLARHWFVRNDWSRFVVVTRDASCHGQASNRCRLRVAGRDGGRLSIGLVPVGVEPAASSRSAAAPR